MDKSKSLNVQEALKVKFSSHRSQSGSHMISEASQVCEIAAYSKLAAA